MARSMIFRFHDSGEDDGTRIYADNGHLLCNRCNSKMRYEYDPDEGVDYAECPNCGFIEITSYDDDDDPENDDYGTYWHTDDDDD